MTIDTITKNALLALVVTGAVVSAPSAARAQQNLCGNFTLANASGDLNPVFDDVPAIAETRKAQYGIDVACDGFLEQACNDNEPGGSDVLNANGSLRRILNAIRLMDNYWYPYDPNKSWHQVAQLEIDDLEPHAECSPTMSASIVNVDVSRQAHMDLPVWTRAGALAHETRHLFTDAKLHNAFCPAAPDWFSLICAPIDQLDQGQGPDVASYVTVHTPFAGTSIGWGKYPAGSYCSCTSTWAMPAALPPWRCVRTGR